MAHRILRTAGLAAIAIAMTGCAERQRERLVQLGEERDQKCRSFGAQPGTEAYVNCRVQLEQVAAVQEQTAAAQNARARAALAQGFANAGAAYSNAANANRPINCTSTRSMGSYTYTTCY